MIEKNIFDDEILENLRGSSILITGAAGMISRNVVSVISELNNRYGLNISIIANELRKETLDLFYADYKDDEKFRMVVGDVRELSVEGKVDYIIHTAGITGGSKKHIDFPMNTISVAIDGTKRVLELAVEKKVKGFIYLSSLEVYGNPGEKKYITETDGGFIDPTNVRSSYSESKRMCECMCASYTKQFGVPAIIARLTATFGYGVNYNDNRVFSQFARSVIEKNDIVLKSSGATVRDYCDAKDTARAFLLLLVKGVPGEAYNIANLDTEISIKDLAFKFIELYPESGISVKFDCQEDPTKLGYNKEMRNVLDSHKLMKLGWVPEYNLDDMIRHLVDSMKETKV